jgi:hypothetical protein
MAAFVPSLGAARFDSRGELRLAERLKGLLEDNACAWHNLPGGPRGWHATHFAESSPNWARSNPVWV